MGSWEVLVSSHAVTSLPCAANYFGSSSWQKLIVRPYAGQDAAKLLSFTGLLYGKRITSTAT